MERKPHFFKGIPVEFVKHISTATSKRVTLQGPSGRCWNAELGKGSKGTFLCGGWAEFAEDHALREYEFLVFRYDGDFTFTVKIFGVNACEREDLFTVIQRKKQKLYEVKDKSRQHVESSLDVGRVLPSQDVKIKSQCDDFPIGIIPSPKKVYKRSCFWKRKLVIHEERSQAPASEAANSFTSKFPFTTVKLCRSHIRQPYVMRLPRAFSHTHLPRKKLVLIIKDPNMKSWEVTYIPHKGHADFLSAGWHNFFHGNDLKVGDVCVFELVKPRQLNVHIFR
ncbi:B3 DNA binding domain-containing protein [Dioscorea alata]|uniref:B3 DNA binding domain-containing protein n=1 Tax=Dioscorea alata TaxID=55571 RepID=A0ACB7WEY4_DIOAL|nr:B3 DNA binding domain-containing protein [Dioscorea alata]